MIASLTMYLIMHNMLTNCESSLQNQPIQTMCVEYSLELQGDNGKNIKYLLFTQ